MGHVKLTVSLPEELAEQLDALAASQCVSRSRIVAVALQAHFRRLESERITREYDAVWGALTADEVEYELAGTRSGAREVKRILLAEEAEPWQKP